MASVESFNRILNESVPANRWEMWAYYRKSLTGFAYDAMNEGSCIIIGPGNLNDIDLNCIKNKAMEITFADIDIESVKEGIEKQGFNGNYDFLKLDIGNLDGSGLMAMVESISKANDFGTILEHHKLDTKIDSTDYGNILLSAVYTQLFIPQFLTIMTGNRSFKDDSLEAALAFSARLISHLNDTVMNLASSGATITAWSDIFEYNNPDPALLDIKKHIGNSQWMDSFNEAYIRDYGHGLGSFGTEDLAKRLHDVKSKWFIWPFDDNRTLIVKVISGKATS
ncbi:MAG: hypothetical protein R3232_09355 [Clostridia bacterium]|nr:hypothetical protein [Clostridia bacterium]